MDQTEPPVKFDVSGQFHECAGGREAEERMFANHRPAQSFLGPAANGLRTLSVEKQIRQIIFQLVVTLCDSSTELASGVPYDCVSL